MLTTPLIPPIADALEAEAARKEAVEKKIQIIVEGYRALGWERVTPVEIENRKYPVISLWPDFWGNTFTAHLNLSGDEPEVSEISLFNKMKFLGSLQFVGKHLTPQEVKTIIETLTGKVIEAEAVEETEETGALAEYNHRYQK